MKITAAAEIKPAIGWLIVLSQGRAAMNVRRMFGLAG